MSADQSQGSETPRTDAQLSSEYGANTRIFRERNYDRMRCPSNFARTLEHELASAKLLLSANQRIIDGASEAIASRDQKIADLEESYKRQLKYTAAHCDAAARLSAQVKTLREAAELVIRRVEDFGVARELVEALSQTTPLEAWQPIETAPKDGTFIEVRNHMMDEPVSASWRKSVLLSGIEAVSWFTNWGRLCCPEEWRPLTPAPKGGES